MSVHLSFLFGYKHFAARQSCDRHTMQAATQLTFCHIIKGFVTHHQEPWEGRRESSHHMFGLSLSAWSGHKELLQKCPSQQFLFSHQVAPCLSLSGAVLLSSETLKGVEGGREGGREGALSHWPPSPRWVSAKFLTFPGIAQFWQKYKECREPLCQSANLFVKLTASLPR